MAESTSTTKLVLTFLDAEGAEANFSYNYADPSLNQTTLGDLIDGMIENKSIFEKKPTTAKSAKLVTTTTTELDLPA